MITRTYFVRKDKTARTYLAKQITDSDMKIMEFPSFEAAKMDRENRCPYRFKTIARVEVAEIECPE